MNVADFHLAPVELASAEAMRVDGYAIPLVDSAYRTDGPFVKYRDVVGLVLQLVLSLDAKPIDFRTKIGQRLPQACGNCQIKQICVCFFSIYCVKVP